MNVVKKIFAVGLLSFAFTSAQAAVVDFEELDLNFYPEVISNGVTFRGYEVGSHLLNPPPSVRDNMLRLLQGDMYQVPLAIDVEFSPVGENRFLTTDTGKYLPPPPLPPGDKEPPTSTAVVMSFDGPVGNVSFHYSQTTTAWWVGAFAGDALVELMPLMPTGPELIWNPYSIEYSDTAGISSVVFMNTGLEPIELWSGDNIALDNITFTSAVPEPSVYALMLGGLGLIGFMANRRRVSDI